MNVIEVSNLSKSYGSNFTLNNINFNLEQGKIFAILGLNGAGKTTFVKLILNLLHPDSGEIKINSVSSFKAEARNGVVFIPEKFSFFPFYTVKGTVEFFAEMRGVSADQIEKVSENAMRELGIYELKDRKLKTLSKGQMQRIGLCNILLGENHLLILDEPFSGLDPIGIKDLKDLLKKQKAQGKSILLNSHILSEMEQVCDQAMIIHQGEVKAKGEVVDIIREHLTLENFFTANVPREI
jgi:ABC-type multidrug transport system ATPase subunit